MWKWIVGVLVVILVLVMGTCYWGFRKLTSGGNSIEVIIKQSPERIFAMFTDPDSLRSWSSAAGQVGRTGTGALQVGDTLTSSLPMSSPTPNAPPSRVDRWVVRVVQAPTLFVLDGIVASDSIGKSKVMLSRRDSLVAMGDSTRIISTFTSPEIENLRAKAGDSGKKVARASMGVLEKLIATGARMGMEMDLQRLKTRLEKP